MRKPIIISNDGAGNLIAVCDDGSVYVMLSCQQAELGGIENKGWIKGKPIPGTIESNEMIALRKITEAWNYYWRGLQEESDVDTFFDAVRDALE